MGRRLQSPLRGQIRARPSLRERGWRQATLHLRSPGRSVDRPCGSGFQPRWGGSWQGGLLCEGATPRRGRSIDSVGLGPTG